MMRLSHTLWAVPVLLALTPLAMAQQPPQNCKFERLAGGGGSGNRGVMTVKTGATCTYSPAPNRGSAPFTGLDITVKPEHGTLVIAPVGNQFHARYTPNAGYTGADHYELAGGILGNPTGEKRMIDLVIIP
jgi:hypothetical protein